MGTMDENLLKYGIRRVAERMAPEEERAMALRSEVTLYDSPHWGEFQRGLERTLTETMWALVDEDDPVQARVLQREARRLRDQIERPTQALAELQSLNRELDSERTSLEGAAGLGTGRVVSPTRTGA